MTDYHLRTAFQQMRGVIGREPAGGDRFIFTFKSASYRGVHMVGVREPLKVTWVVRGEVEATEVLQPWTGFARHLADEIIEEAAPA